MKKKTLEKNYPASCKEIRGEAYQQGAREFAEWLCEKSDFETIDFKGMWNIEENGNRIFYLIDEVLAKWQKERKNEQG